MQDLKVGHTIKVLGEPALDGVHMRAVSDEKWAQSASGERIGCESKNGVGKIKSDQLNKTG